MLRTSLKNVISFYNHAFAQLLNTKYWIRRTFAFSIVKFKKKIQFHVNNQVATDGDSTQVQI